LSFLGSMLNKSRVWSLYLVSFLVGLSPSGLMAQAISETNIFPYNAPNMSPAEFILHAPTCLWRWNRQSVPKRRHIKFRRRGITQKKAYNI